MTSKAAEKTEEQDGGRPGIVDLAAPEGFDVVVAGKKRTLLPPTAAAQARAVGIVRDRAREVLGADPLRAALGEESAPETAKVNVAEVVEEAIREDFPRLLALWINDSDDTGESDVSPEEAIRTRVSLPLLVEKFVEMFDVRRALGFLRGLGMNPGTAGPTE